MECAASCSGVGNVRVRDVDDDYHCLLFSSSTDSNLTKLIVRYSNLVVSTTHIVCPEECALIGSSSQSSGPPEHVLHLTGLGERFRV